MTSYNYKKTTQEIGQCVYNGVIFYLCWSWYIDIHVCDTTRCIISQTSKTRALSFTLDTQQTIILFKHLQLKA